MPGVTHVLSGLGAETLTAMDGKTASVTKKMYPTMNAMGAMVLHGRSPTHSVLAWSCTSTSTGVLQRLQWLQREGARTRCQCG